MKFKILTSVVIFLLLIFYAIIPLTSVDEDEPCRKSNERDISSNFNINCDKLFTSNPKLKDIISAEKWRKGDNETCKNSDLTEKIKKNCTNYLKDNQYFLTSNDEKERQFSIAFTIVTFKNAVQVERLLRTIYRPWNYYCIHVDIKAHRDFFQAVEQLTNCLNEEYNNIVNTKDRVNVVWGTMSVLTADLNCMKELYDRYKTWKYLINLTGQEFPLKTNKELVKILKAYNGANNIEGTYKRREDKYIPDSKMPFPIIWYKGSVHITANRDFIKYIFGSPKARTILSHLEGHYIPDEQFFATLNFNPNLRIPGSFIGDLDEGAPLDQPLYYFITRFKNWGEYSCLSDKVVRQICIWGVRDLPKLAEAKHLFANKFYEDFQPATLHCLEKLYYDKVKSELISGKTKVDEEYYKSLIFVKNQFQPNYK